MILLITYIFATIVFILTWVLYRYLKNPSVVDCIWSLSIMAIGLIYLSQSISHRTMLIATLLVIWALRLSGYIWWTRIRIAKVDKRYLQLSSQWRVSQSLGFFFNFQLQALLAWICAIPFYFSVSPTFILTDSIAITLVLIGIIGEATIDSQLHQFQRTHPHTICDDGLWNYSRHPNYFFEWVTWIGFACFGISSTLGCISLVSPLMLYMLFTRVTGPITENASIKSHGEAYLKYQSRTSMLIPWRK
jgi:steroid 5-alpha reductase family enzyme